ncbi:MAG: SprT-like domain-containing protein [Deltaproteobacteria bacterium]|nr:SprT-like domain-containing protein [Deltaproteobacteria bacterium]
MTFELNELRRDFLKLEYVAPNGVSHWGGIDLNITIDQWKLEIIDDPEDSSMGRCDKKDYKIMINNHHIENVNDFKNTLLHEMIHAYEYMLPETYKQYLVLFIYQRIQWKRLGNRALKKLIKMDQHADMLVHTLLFLLKSIQLDLARRLPLGTIYGYGREKLF